MKVLFIGGTGTISAACARLCVQQGTELWLVLRGTRDDRVPPGAHVIHGDIKREPASVRGLLDRHRWDCVVDWVAFEEEDVLRDVELFRGKTSKFVFISSTGVYRKPLPSLLISEATPTGNTQWEYAHKKERCERLFLQHHEASGFPVVIVRPGHTYAEFALPSGFAGMGFGIAERILKGKSILVHGDGSGLWTLTFNEDFARAFVPLMALDSAVGEAFHITSDEVLTWVQIYDLIGEAFGRGVSYVFASSHLINEFDAELGTTLLADKAYSQTFDNSKIKRYVPSFAARMLFRHGARLCADWYSANRDRVKIDPAKDRLMDAIVSHVKHMESAAGELPLGAQAR